MLVKSSRIVGLSTILYPGANTPVSSQISHPALAQVYTFDSLEEVGYFWGSIQEFNHLGCWPFGLLNTMGLRSRSVGSPHSLFSGTQLADANTQ
jgi:hypothetical protein